MPKSKLKSGGKYKGKSHSYAAGGTVSDISAFKRGGTKVTKNRRSPGALGEDIGVAPKDSSIYPPLKSRVNLGKEIADLFRGKPESPGKKEATLNIEDKGRTPPKPLAKKSEAEKAQKRFRQPSDPADKGPKHEQRIVNIAEKDRKGSLSAARKAGHLYYWKDGKKMAAVTGGDLKKAGYTRLRDYMNRQLKKKRRIEPKHTKEEHEKKKGGWQ